jgi:hypothetical protein
MINVQRTAWSFSEGSGLPERKTETNMQKIIVNRIRCRVCGDIIESRYTHEFVTCSCGRVSVDGGHEYLRRGYKNSPDDYIELSEYGEEIEVEFPSWE